MVATGTGPGPISADGSAVEVYAALAANGEADIVHEAVGAGASVLELGAGAGRVTHPLLALGHPVVAVDDSAEMLARIERAETVHSRIQDLELDRRFDCVLLASHLVNVPDDGLRAAFLDRCRHHLRPGGPVLVERLPPRLFSDPPDGRERTVGGVRVVMRDVSRPAPNHIRATMHYAIGDRRWTHTFTSRWFDVAELAEHGLRLHRLLTADGRWFSAVPR